MINKSKKIFIECSCHTELIQLEYEGDDDMLYMAYYTYSRQGKKYYFMNRLRLIWKIIRDGHPYSDGVVLDPSERKKLLKFLQSIKDKKRSTIKMDIV